MKNIIFAILSFIISCILFTIYFAVWPKIYALIPAIILLIASVFFVMMFISYRQKLHIKELEKRIEVWNKLSYHVNQAGDEAVDNLPIGILVYENEQIKWTNDYLKGIFKARLIDAPLYDVIPALDGMLDSKNKSFVIQYENDYYEVLNYRDENVLYFFNVTERETIKKKYDNRITAIGIILLDNLEESLKDYDMQEKSTIRGQFLGEISDYVRNYGAYLQSYDDDRLVMILDKESLGQMVENKFEVLNQARDIATKNHVRVSVSIGVACYDVEPDELGGLAQSAVELAEKRGGDQVVVNIQNEKIKYFGGKTDALEKNSLVQARIEAQELKDAVEGSTNVYITGHMGADADCLGAMICVLRMVMSSNKEAHIVFDMAKADKNILKMYEALRDESPEIFSRFIPFEDVEVRPNSLLIVCDTQSPKIMMFPELEKNIKHVAVIDHHRRGEISFIDPVVSYVEPYASSTVELVSEMIMFYNKGIKFEPIDATCMLAGLVIDTNNFTFRSSGRTFEAASTIKSLGGDMIRVRQLIRPSYEIEKDIASAVTNSNLFMEKYAISVLPNDKIISDRSFLAQIADKLMGIDGVEASFAIGYLSQDTIGISARSYEKINVQLVMEEMGGGGHLSNAACQIKDKPIDEVLNHLKEIIEANNENEGEEKMKVILIADVKGRGNKGQIIDVANGYGNYLLTNKLAIQATDENIKQVEAEKEKEKEDAENHYQLMLKLKSEIESKSINIFLQVGGDGKLFSHITTKRIADEFAAQTGITIDKRKIFLPAEINSVGIFTAIVDLGKNVQATIEMNVLEK